MTKRQKYQDLLHAGFTPHAAGIISGYDEHKDVEEEFRSWVRFVAFCVGVIMFGLFIGRWA